MATCKRCGNTKVEWVKDKLQYKLYNIADGTWHGTHNGSCIPDPEFQNKWNKSNEKRKSARSEYLREHPEARNKWDDRDGL